MFVVVAAAVAVYVPAVQCFAVRKAAEIVARETGLRVTVAEFRVRFPLGVEAGGVDVVTAQGDTLAHLAGARVRAGLAPLLRGNVRVMDVEARGVRVRWRDTLSGVSLAARVELLEAGSALLDMRRRAVRLSRARVDGGEAAVTMGAATANPPEADTAAFDWNVEVGRFDLSRFGVALDVEGGEGAAEGAPPFDFRHMAASGAAVSVRNLRYSAEGLALRFEGLGLAERSGLRVRDGGGDFAMGPEGFRLDDFSLDTEGSHIEGRAEAGAGAVRMEGDAAVAASVAASVAADEAALFVPLDARLAKALEGKTLRLDGEVKGTLDDLAIESFMAELPGHATLAASGRVRRALSPEGAEGSVKLRARAADLDFARAFVPDPSLRERLRIPRGVSLDADADFTPRGVEVRAASLGLDTARIEASGRLDLDARSYAADVRVRSLPVDRFLPHDSIGVVTAALTASGHGFDPATMTASASVELTRARYGSVELGRVTAEAAVDGGNVRARVDSRNDLASGRVTVEGTIGRDTLWSAPPGRRAATAPLAYRFTARVDSTYLSMGGERHLVGPADIAAAASAAGTRAAIASDDLDAELSSPLAPDTLVRGAMRAANEVRRQLAAHNFNADSLQGAFPAMRLKLDAGRTGFLHGVARAGGMDFRTARADISTGPEGPFHIDVSIFSVRAADIVTDTVALHAIRNADRLDYSLRLANRPGDPAEPKLIRVAGSVGGNTLTANVLQRNSAGETGFDATLTATLRDSTVRVELADGPTLGYRRWKVGDDGDMHHPAGAFDHPATGPGNWLESDLNGRLRADLHLTSDKPTATGRGSRGGGTSVGMGAAGLQWGGTSAIASVIAGARSHVSLTSSSLPGISHGAVRLSVAGLDIGPMLDLFPSAPRVDGVLSTDLTVGFLPPGEENGGVVAARGTLGARDFAYEGRRVADVEAEVDFGADAAGTMRLDAAMKLEKETALTARGTYAAGAMEVTVDIPAVPLAVVQRLLPPGTATLSGSLGGRLHLAGDAARPEISGDVGFVDGRARIDMLGTTFGISTERIKMEAGRVTFRDWGLTAPNNRQLRVNGTVNVADPAAPAADVAIRASNFQFVNSNHIGGSQIYGRAALSADVTATGPLGAVKVRGDVRLTDDTDIVYIMRQGSTLRDERQHVVRFERFADTLDLDWTPPPVAAPRVGMDMLLRVVAREGMKATVSMDEVNENRVELIGGGDLSMSVNREGDVRLAGRYILSGGTLHYRPPLIPRKVFAVAEGSYVEWRGRPLEPELHITARQSTSVRLDHDGGTSEDVRFDITAAVTGSLNGMDISFDLAAPDNMSIQDQLLAMSPEGRMQAALSMMIYNRYSGPGVSSRGMALDARGQINDFISREINQWARNNMRGVDFSVGIATRDGAVEGDSETDYSYSVSKRLLSDRMKITIGGKVSDRGANDAGSLLEDVELEYRLNRRENIFFKLYRYNTRASMLEGEVTETGAGFVMRRKVTKVKNLFKRLANPFAGGRRRRTGRGDDGERRDSLPPRKATQTETKSDETEP